MMSRRTGEQCALCHCEEASDEAIYYSEIEIASSLLFLAMTV